MGSLDPLLKRVFADHTLERFENSIIASPEWRAWARAWLETVPLTPEEELANAEWRARLPAAKDALVALLAEHAEEIANLEAAHRVKIYDDGEGEWYVDDDPPHKPKAKPKEGAPPAPPIWPTGGGKIAIRHFNTPDTQLGGPDVV